MSELNDTLPIGINETISQLNSSILDSNVTSYLNQTKEFVNQFSRNLAFTVYDSKLNNHIEPIYISYFTIVSLACLLIYIASFATLEKPTNALPPNPNHPLFDQTDKDTTYIKDAAIDEPHALMMPLFAGVGLVGLYFGLQKFDKTKLSYYLNKYILVISLKSNTFTITYFLKSALRSICYKFGISSLRFNKRYTLTFSNDTMIHSSGIEENLSLPDYTEKEKIIKEELLLESRNDIAKEDQLFNYYFSAADIYGWIFGLLSTVAFAYLDGADNWLLSNILSASSVIACIPMGRLPSFKPAFIILVFFFFYDIYFVFGSNVMMEVATKIDIPVKLLIPMRANRELNEISMSMLGLGDLIIPGMAISLCLRYDLFKHHKEHPNTEYYHLQKFKKPYFTCALISYAIGLITTIIVLHVYKHGQPALLYLSPALLISIVGMAIKKGDLKNLLKYNEDPHSDTKLEDKNAIDIDIICSKETLFLAGAISAEDEDDKDDFDYVDESEIELMAEELESEAEFDDE
ncbi:hypothetical protein CANARDRAFT_5631 [[Candida] arabinofermentans NRRL YB-2248]|uniref:Uncharacterized protein n=1 Tax=[Candida] arabinofermentans NRRL YB-2248 TaxID=983967 RepID=A0A1E4T5N8_9ASCO|nr:hypothetical protein CANARDRAFT_5631 [[Candida] arabinofermentans NRRL YB-2248]